MPESLTPESLATAVLGIVLVDLVLSSDNAVVIGLAARQLSGAQRQRAILVGGAGAIGLRMLFTALAGLLLRIPLLQFAGGLILIWIAWKLLQGPPPAASHEVAAGETLGEAVRIIITADAVMSLDNILAVGGLSHGQVLLLLFGLGLSMPILLFGSTLVALVTRRLPVLAYLGGAILAWTAGTMLLSDPWLSPLLRSVAALQLLLPLGLTIGLPILSLAIRERGQTGPTLTSPRSE